jgi:phosphatidate cytidylyltransferase
MLRWRLLSAAVILCIVLTLTAFDFQRVGGATPGLWLMPFMLAITVMATEEVLSLFAAKGLRPVAWPVYAGSVVTTLAFARPMCAAWLTDSPLSALDEVVSWPLLALASAVVVVLAVEVRRFDGPGQHVIHLALAVFAVVYVGLLGGFMVGLRLLGDNATGIVALVSMVAVTKLSDTGAYTFGRLFGTTKFVPKLSPGKTVEGVVGGIATACAASWIFFRLIAPQISPAFETQGPSYAAILIYGAILAVAGIVGDLAESLLKRDMQRKDSSTWLPGLGGVLDIADSLFTAGPAAYLCWQLGLLN